jgi:hypothetical protein
MGWVLALPLPMVWAGWCKNLLSCLSPLLSLYLARRGLWADLVWDPKLRLHTGLFFICTHLINSQMSPSPIFPAALSYWGSFWHVLEWPCVQTGKFPLPFWVLLIHLTLSKKEVVFTLCAKGTHWYWIAAMLALVGFNQLPVPQWSTRDSVCIKRERFFGLTVSEVPIHNQLAPLLRVCSEEAYHGGGHRSKISLPASLENQDEEEDTGVPQFPEGTHPVT